MRGREEEREGEREGGGGGGGGGRRRRRCAAGVATLVPGKWRGERLRERENGVKDVDDDAD